MSIHNPATFPRIKIHYATQAGAHVMTVHQPMAVTGFEAADNATAIVTVLRGLLHTSQSFSQLDFAPAGSNIFNPVSWTPLAGTSSIALTPYYKAFELSFVGRTATGTRARLFMFTDFLQGDNNYRITVTESPGLAPVFDMLNHAPPYFVAADGLAPVWKSYMNVRTNEHWLRKLRAA